MKAITYKQYGPPHVLHVDEIEKPTAKDDEVLIKVEAVEATKSDCEMRSFNFPIKWTWLPLRLALGITKPRRQVLGIYFAGEVVEVGKDVSDFRIGDQVYGSTGFRFGAYGKYVNVSASESIVPKPTNLSFEEAAAVPLGGWNAIHFMRRGNIQPGETVLINGAGGSIGLFGVQIAKSMGAEVTAVDSGIKEAMVRSIGADHFIDYAQEDFTQSGQRYDVILNSIAHIPYSDCIKALKPKGRYLNANPRFFHMLRAPITSRFTDKQSIFAFAGEKKEELLALKEMIEAGKLRPVVDKIYSMDDAAEAHQRVETEQRLGSVVIGMGS